MSTVKNPTKKEMFNRLLTLAPVTADPELVAFVEHQLELLSNKANRKPSEKEKAKQEHDKALRVVIVDEMSPDEAYTADDLIKTCPTLTTEPNITAPKVSYLIRELLADGSVVKFTDKRKTYYKLAD